MTLDDAQKLITIHNTCRNLAINWQMEYVEACDQWEFELSSAAPVECKVFRKYGGAGGCTRMLDTVLDFLNELSITIDNDSQ